MSQEKVERYKKEKANRKQTMKKDKAKSIAARTADVIVCIALIGWIGYSGYSKWEAKQPAKTTAVSTDALSGYLDELSTE